MVNAEMEQENQEEDDLIYSGHYDEREDAAQIELAAATIEDESEP